MNKNRIEEHPVLGKLENQMQVTFTFNGEQYTGFEGDTIASALLANGIRKLRVQEAKGTPRGIYCNIGHCFECRVTVDEEPGVRACLQEIKADMVVESGQMLPSPLDPSIDPEKLPRNYADYSNNLKGDKKEGNLDV